MSEWSFQNLKPEMKPLVRNACLTAFERAKVDPEGLSEKIDALIGDRECKPDDEDNMVEFVRFSIEHRGRYYEELVLTENFTNGDQSAKAEGGKE
jgi:hypothetical protein